MYFSAIQMTIDSFKPYIDWLRSVDGFCHWNRDFDDAKTSQAPRPHDFGILTSALDADIEVSSYFLKPVVVGAMTGSLGAEWLGIVCLTNPRANRVLVNNIFSFSCLLKLCVPQESRRSGESPPQRRAVTFST